MEPSEIQKSKHPCVVCAKRKVKCDRLIPCTYCVKRGFEQECVKVSDEEKTNFNSNSSSPILRFWQSYEYWITDIGLFKSFRDSESEYVDLKRDLDTYQYLCEFLTRDQSFQLLDYSMEKLGPLYFGFLSDISDLYLLLEEYWQNREEVGEKNLVFTVDEHYSNALLWSVFSLAVYYIPSEKLRTIFPRKPSLPAFAGDGTVAGSWTEKSQLILCQCFTDYTINQLHDAGLLAHPDLRLIQIYLILFATGQPQTSIPLGNSLLLLCFNAAKINRVDDFRPLIGDSTVLRLTKITCEKLWYSLCSCDYLQSGPGKPSVFHTQISSLLQHAAYLEDLPNTDVYQSEESFEVLYWKILSLDRDLDQYLNKETKPPLKTLDAVQRQTEIFSRKIVSSEDSPSLNSDFSKFLVSFLLNTISWKLQKMYFIYFEITNGLTKSIHIAKSLIALVVKNIKTRKNTIFNKHPIVMWSLSRIATFYAFYEMVSGSEEIQSLNFDIREVLQNLPAVLEPHLSCLSYLLARFQSLKELWENVEPKSTSEMLRHPVMTILENDVAFFSQQIMERPSTVRGSARIIIRQESPRLDRGNEGDREAFRPLVVEFESQFPIDYLTKRKTEAF